MAKTDLKIIEINVSKSHHSSTNITGCAVNFKGRRFLFQKLTSLAPRDFLLFFLALDNEKKTPLDKTRIFQWTTEVKNKWL